MRRPEPVLVRAILLGALVAGISAWVSASRGPLLPANDPSYAGRYQAWKLHYQALEGDRRVRIGLGAVRGISPQTNAVGSVTLDLYSGEVTASAAGLSRAVEIWLVDNGTAGSSVLPEDGDRTLRVGRLAAPDGRIAASLGAEAFQSFEVDLVVATAAGAGPHARPVLVGGRSGFERRYSRERLGLALPAVAADGDGEGTDPRVELGLVDPAVLTGGEIFFRETFEGNGRSCGTCHPAANDQVIDPAFVERLRQQSPDDPLFIADPGRADGVPGLEIPELLEQLSLIRENVDGFEAPTEKFVMRGVPHSLSLATSLAPPLPDENGELPDGSNLDFEQRTGWSGDGVFAPGTLRLFPVGAVIQHYTRDVDLRDPGPDSFRLPSDEELDALEAFLLSTGRTADLDLEEVSLADAAAERGRVLFNLGAGGGAKCFACHQNAGADSAFGGNRNLDTGIEQVRPARLDDLAIPRDGGFAGQGLADFDFDSDGDGVPDSFGNGTFNTPPLIEAADTTPLFHNNAFDTIEGAVEFYNSEIFAASPGGVLVESAFGEGIDLDRRETLDVAAFLRVLNAAFNLDIAIQRVAAVREIDKSFGRSEIPLTNELLRLANDELRDARRVLRDRRLGRLARTRIRAAIALNRHALNTRNPLLRGFYAALAERLAARAKESLGQGLDFELGEANLVF